LAKTQAGAIKDALVAKGHNAELVIIVTDGDDRADDPIAVIGIGVFTAALREAVHDGRCDVADRYGPPVHHRGDTAARGRQGRTGGPRRAGAGGIAGGFGDRYIEPATDRAA
jgi:hypothetical protein